MWCTSSLASGRQPTPGHSPASVGLVYFASVQATDQRQHICADLQSTGRSVLVAAARQPWHQCVESPQVNNIQLLTLRQSAQERRQGRCDAGVQLQEHQGCAPWKGLHRYRPLSDSAADTHSRTQWLEDLADQRVLHAQGAVQQAVPSRAPGRGSSPRSHLGLCFRSNTLSRIGTRS